MYIALQPVIEEVPRSAEQLDSLLQSGYRYALALTHDAGEAEDLLQDACVAVVRSGGKWERSYLFATIRNRFIDRYRRNKKILFVSLEGRAEAKDLEQVVDLPDVIRVEALNRALELLRSEERETLFLAIVEGYTAKQIASMTRRPRGTVLSLLHRTKAKLRRLLYESQEKIHE